MDCLALHGRSPPRSHGKFMSILLKRDQGNSVMGTRRTRILCALAITACTVAAQEREYRDPRSFPFHEAVSNPEQVIVTQRSTTGYGNHPRGSDDPLFVAQELLGRPTDTSVTINAAAVEDLEAYYEYGTESGTYHGSTEVVRFPAGEPVHVLIEGLAPNAQHYYRMRYRKPGDPDFRARPEHSFHTQRPSGSAFTFVVQFDPHMMETNDPVAFKSSLAKMLADSPDFLIDLGDTFFIDRILREGPATQAHITHRAELLRSYFDLINHSVPLFLVMGNHEGEWGRHLDGTPDNIAVLGTLARKTYFPNPEPNDFYSGGTRMEPFVGVRQSYYAWHWGDALFIALDPYWYEPVPPEQAGDWRVTLGRDQFEWLKRTLETSAATFKFVFSHNLIGGLNMRGQMRGGIETVKYLEMGGYNLDGTWGFDEARPGWAMPIHQLLVAHNATIYFHGHDHLYVKQDLDGIVYQVGPVPARSGLYDATQSARNYNYNHGTVIGGSGYLRVKVSSGEVTVDYVQTYLPDEEDETRRDGMVAHSYTIVAD